MKMRRHNTRKALIRTTVCFLFVITCSVKQAIGFDGQSRRFAAADSGFAKSDSDAARLIIRRIPNLGNHLIVDLYVDGVAVPGIGYGRSFEGLLRPGRHILSVRPTPHPKWLTRWQLTLDVRNGRTYIFTAMGNHSGDLILRRD